jgi:hypothetical protein
VSAEVRDNRIYGCAPIISINVSLSLQYVNALSSHDLNKVTLWERKTKTNSKMDQRGESTTNESKLITLQIEHELLKWNINANNFQDMSDN